jgi:hypothetical protein
MDPARTDSPPRRRKWFIAGAVVLVLAGILLFSGGGSNGAGVSLTFAGFTNVDNKARALFWVTNGAKPSMHLIVLASQREGNSWAIESERTTQSEEEMEKANGAASWIPPRQVMLISFPVGEAKLPLRTVMTVWVKVNVLEKVRFTVKGLLNGHPWNGPDSIVQGSWYSVTNEFHPKP